MDGRKGHSEETERDPNLGGGTGQSLQVHSAVCLRWDSTDFFCPVSNGTSGPPILLKLSFISARKRQPSARKQV